MPVLACRRFLDFSGFLATWLLLCGVAWACKTPVYRYAMYRWEPAPYEVYYFHDADVPPGDRAAHESINKLLADSEAAPNLAFQTIDLRQDEKLEGLPRDVRDLFLARRPALPAYLVLSPEGNEIHRGSLTSADVEALVDSPARRELAGHLADAKAGVFLVLASGQPEEAQAAEELCRKLIEQVRTGELALYDPELDEGGAAADKKPAGQALQPAGAPSDPTAKKSPPLPAVVVVRRDDPREAWFVKQLLAVESDLATLPGPMVYPAFGRGRVLPPYLAKGINSANLAEGLHYVTGACACTVKEQNPGHELLMRHPWHQVAEAMAKRFNAEEGSGLAFRDLQIFPQGEPVTNDAPAAAAETKNETPPDAPLDPAARSSVFPDQAARPGKAGLQRDPAAAPAPPRIPVDNSGGQAGHSSPPAPPVALSAAPPEVGGGMLQYLGIGIAAVVILLAAATWAMRNPAS